MSRLYHLQGQQEKDKHILLEHGYDPEPDLTRKTTWKEFMLKSYHRKAA